ncbi:glutamate--tRNA ligase [Candidatus Woesearchaeota archaeon]|nr:glutamate--tRNA ligase [Candidatus Woesearchaeota archaeon]
MSMHIKHPDKKNALSIIEASEKELMYTLKLPVIDESAFNIIRNIYECFRMLGDARMISKGFVSQDHIEQIKELETIPVQTERPIKLINTLRRIRHNINYYGYIPTKAEAEDAISIAKACFYPLLEALKKELKSSNPIDLIEKTAYKYALQNAVRYNGKANSGAVIGKLFLEHKDIKKEDVIKTVNEIVKKVNKLSLEQQTKELEKIAPELLHIEVKKADWKELPHAVMGKVKTRMPPEPSKYPHLGHALAFIINRAYADKYQGKCILRFDDTNPELAKQEYIDAIEEDIRWLQLKYDEKIVASTHMNQYYKYTEQLMEMKKAYACFCTQEEVKVGREKRKRCSCSTKYNAKEEWKKMLEGKYKEGQCSLRLVGDMTSDNGVLRDPVIMRISFYPHYLQKNKYHIWPMYDFESAIEDSINGITHIIRSKEFELRLPLHNLIKDLLHLSKEHVIEIGRFNLIGYTTKGREIRELMEQNKVKGWDDPQLVTVKALRRRGFDPQTFWELAKEVGLTKTETNITDHMLEAINRKIIDKKAKRYFMVDANAKKIMIGDHKLKEATVPLHPEIKEHGHRVMNISNEFYVDDEIKKGKIYRFMHLFNFKDNKFVSEPYDPKLNAQLIHWLPVSKELVKVEILMTDGTTTEGLGEPALKDLQVGDVIQFERKFFARLDKKEKEKLCFVYTHK